MGIVTLMVVLVMVALSACGEDTGSSNQPPLTITPSPETFILQTTPTPEPSFQPTVGMLSSVPIGRMPMECFEKESVSENNPFRTAACGAEDKHRAMHIIAWDWTDAPKEGIRIYLVYFEELTQGTGTTIVCDDVVFDKKAGLKVRGDTLEGTCTRFRHSRSDAIYMIGMADEGWTSVSGLSKPYSRDGFDGIFELLKR